MRTISAKEFFILGMVASQPTGTSGISGTTLNRLMRERNVEEWSRLSFSSVYYVLNQLEKKALIKASEASSEEEERSEVGAPRKLYTVTAKGKKVLKKTVKEYFNSDNLNYQEMNLALAAAHALSDSEFLTALRSNRKRLEERLNKVRGKYDEDRKGFEEEELPVYVWALFNYAFHSLQARKAFLDEVIERLEKMENSPKKYE
ncbi:MAG: PadR family transcriptional regulator [Candidatus Odinarchaeota archaeon]